MGDVTTTKPCACFMGYTVGFISIMHCTNIIMVIWRVGSWEIWMQMLEWNFQSSFSDWYILCPHMNAMGPYWWEVNIGSGNGLVPSGSKPIPEPILTQIYVAYDVIFSTVSLIDGELCNQGGDAWRPWVVFKCGRVCILARASLVCLAVVYSLTVTFGCINHCSSESNVHIRLCATKGAPGTVSVGNTCMWLSW